jgi:hypothetical protein
LTVGATTAEVEVTAGAEAVQTNTSQITNDFGARAVQDLPTPPVASSTSLPARAPIAGTVKHGSSTTIATSTPWTIWRRSQI